MAHSLRPRQNLSQEVAQSLRKQILEGGLAPGARLSETRLAKDLGVSRTPIREGIAVLVAEGFLTAEPRRGVTVTELTVEEVRELYPLRAILDPAALRLSPLPSADDLEELRALNARIVRETDPASLVDLDDLWHRTLLRGCPNQILLGFIDQLIARSRRYEVAYLSETGHVKVAGEQHEAVLCCLENEDTEGACHYLAANMSQARQPLLDWLGSRARN